MMFSFDNFKSYHEFVQRSQRRITIDCGHTPISIYEDQIVFGKNLAEPSESEIQTLKLALEIAKNMIAKQKIVTINFCFSDVGENMNPTKRAILKKMFFDIQILKLLPKKYRDILSLTPEIKLRINFQSANSNLSTNLIKKIKKNIKKTPFEKTIEKYNCGFVLKNECTFGINSPALFNHSFLLESPEKFKYLLNPYVVPDINDRIKYPLINLIRSKFIGLYDKFDGILCPATYMGNLLDQSFEDDIISIYSRNDDSAIGEKILAGAICYYHLVQHRRFYSVVLNNNSEVPETFFLDPSLFGYQKNNFLQQLTESILNKQEYKRYQ